MRYVVVAYDISDDRRRDKIAKELERFGYRVQKSVFECYVSEKEYKAMKRTLKSLMDPDDKVYFYTLCSVCTGKIERLGKEEFLPSEESITVC